MKRIYLVIALLLFPLFYHCNAQTVPDNTNGRLWRLCKLWGYMKYYHPNTCQVRWDSLLNATIPGVISASSNAGFNNEIMGMLNYLGQVPAALASAPPATDTNLNLNLDWSNDPEFSVPVLAFLDTFTSRAGKNDSMTCRSMYNIINNFFDADSLTIPLDFGNEANRLTIAFHYWNRFNYYGVYRNLSDIPWDTTLLYGIADIRAATNDSTFRVALAKINSKTDDSHGIFPMKYLVSGRYVPLIILNRIENKIVVTKVDSAIAGIHAGDVLLKIDGQPADTIAHNFLKDRIAASNISAFYRDVCVFLLCGAANTSMNLELSGPGNMVYQKTISRNVSFDEWYTWKTRDSVMKWKILCNNYGYVNMGALAPEDTALMYNAMKNQPAIIFDVRNYPKTSAFELGRYFLKSPPTTALFYYPDEMALGRFYTADDSENLGNWDNPDAYPGKLYFLVNEQTQSAAEYFSLYMRHAPDAQIVGSQTAGADGGAAMMSLTADIKYYFTLVGIYYYDGYQCQRNGLRLDRIITPTIQGIRDGRDEMLESITECSTGIKVPRREFFNVNVFPNPVKRSLHINIESQQAAQAHLAVYDLSGRLCYQWASENIKTGNNVLDFDLKDLRKGMYILKISGATSEAFYQKFIKD